MQECAKICINKCESAKKRIAIFADVCIFFIGFAPTKLYILPKSKQEKMQENEPLPSFLKVVREITLTDVKDLGDSQKAAVALLTLY